MADLTLNSFVASCGGVLKEGDSSSDVPLEQISFVEISDVSNDEAIVIYQENGLTKRYSFNNSDSAKEFVSKVKGITALG